jgi:hypothetical protein
LPYVPKALAFILTNKHLLNCVTHGNTFLLYFEDTVILVQDSGQVPAMLSGIVVSYR